jgi:hypothetical protein
VEQTLFAFIFYKQKQIIAYIKGHINYTGEDLIQNWQKPILYIHKRLNAVYG